MTNSLPLDANNFIAPPSAPYFSQLEGKSTSELEPGAQYIQSRVEGEAQEILSPSQDDRQANKEVSSLLDREITRFKDNKYPTFVAKIVAYVAGFFLRFDSGKDKAAEKIFNSRETKTGEPEPVLDRIGRAREAASESGKWIYDLEAAKEYVERAGIAGDEGVKKTEWKNVENSLELAKKNGMSHAFSQINKEQYSEDNRQAIQFMLGVANEFQGKIQKVMSNFSEASNEEKRAVAKYAPLKTAEQTSELLSLYTEIQAGEDGKSCDELIRRIPIKIFKEITAQGKIKPEIVVKYAKGIQSSDPIEARKLLAGVSSLDPKILKEAKELTELICWRQGEEKLDGKCLYALGECYANGTHGVERNLDKALDYFARTSRNGPVGPEIIKVIAAHPNINLGKFEHFDPLLLTYYIFKSAQAGHSEAQFLLASRTDTEACARLLKKRGYDFEQYYYVDERRSYYPTNGQNDHYWHWIGKAAGGGHSEASFLLAKGLYDGGSIGASAAYYIQGAKGNFKLDSESYYRLGVFYQGNNGVTANSAEASKFFIQAAELGHGLSMSILGKLCEEKGDFPAAGGWYEKAADAGDTNALNHLVALAQKKARTP